MEFHFVPQRAIKHDLYLNKGSSYKFLFLDKKRGNPIRTQISSRYMDMSKYPLDLILVPLSVFFTVSYHTYRWKYTKGKHTGTTKDKNAIWIDTIFQEDKKNGMLGVQSLRNSLMASVLSATISILLNSALAALTNNAYKSNLLSHHKFFGSQGAPTVLLKYATISLLLLLSFFCSSMAVGILIEANFMINACGESLNEVTEDLMKKGWELASFGNRVLFSSAPFMIWLFGPVPLAISSLAVVGFFYTVDFGSNAVCK